MKNNLFQDIHIKEPLHPKYLMLRDHINFIYHRQLLNEWFSGFQDRDNKIIKEFQTTFHSSFWEIFLYKVFKELRFTIDFAHSRPDFILKPSNSDKEIYVEATVANISDYGEPESSRTMDDIISMFTPPQWLPNFEEEINESIIRYSNSIRGKTKKYKKDYINCEWVSTENPYVIALSSCSQINYGREYIFGIMALLYGEYYIKDDNDFIDRECIQKKGNWCKNSTRYF